MSQHGPWDMRVHYEGVHPTGAVQAALGPSPPHAVTPHDAAPHGQPPPGAHPAQRRRHGAPGGPHPFEDLFDQTHIDLLA